MVPAAKILPFREGRIGRGSRRRIGGNNVGGGWRENRRGLSDEARRVGEDRRREGANRQGGEKREESYIGKRGMQEGGG